MAKSGFSNVKKIIILLIFFIIVAIIAMTSIIIYYVENNSNSSSETNVQEEISEVEETDETEEYEYPEFVSSKIITSAEYASEELEYQLKAYDSIGVFSAVLDDGKVYLQLEDLTGTVSSLYPYSQMEKNNLYEITNIEANVIDVEIGYIRNKLFKSDNSYTYRKRRCPISKNR